MIPMQRPLLPDVAALRLYLDKIDNSRWYSNRGPLVRAYEERLENLFNCHVAAVSSGTSGMTAALLTQNLSGRRINVQSWTFVATANILRAAGHVPAFQDVDETTWRIKDYNERGLYGVLVSPFGAPVLNINPDPQPLLIDAAASFDLYATGQVRAGATPVIISTHATKCFSTGEGGLVLSDNAKLIDHVREIINHGLTSGREVPVAGINGKPSEYHAAVGLASLDCWNEIRSQWLEMKSRYVNAFGALSHTTPLSSLSWVGSTFAVRLIGRDAEPVRQALAVKGIMSRKVWGDGVHRYAVYNGCPRNCLPVTERLAREVLFVPFSIDTSEQQLRFISDEVMKAIDVKPKPYEYEREINPNMWGV